MDVRRQLRTVAEVARRTVAEAVDDDLLGEAAKAAFYFALSLFPFILVLFAVTGLVGREAAFAWIMERIHASVPSATAQYLARFVREVTSHERPGLLSFGLAFTVLSASRAVMALGDGLNAMYDIEDRRSWWKRQLIALGLVLATAAALATGALAVVAGPQLADALGLGVVGQVLRLPGAFALLVALHWMFYFVLPNRRRRRASGAVLVGAVFGAACWLLGTWLFRIYVANWGDYSRTYGVVGGLIAMLLWLYLTSLTVLLGGELAAVLEDRARATSSGLVPRPRVGAGTPAPVRPRRLAREPKGASRPRLGRPARARARGERPATPRRRRLRGARGPRST